MDYENRDTEDLEQVAHSTLNNAVHHVAKRNGEPMDAFAQRMLEVARGYGHPRPYKFLDPELAKLRQLDGREPNSETDELLYREALCHALEEWALAQLTCIDCGETTTDGELNAAPGQHEPNRCPSCHREFMARKRAVLPSATAA